MYFTGGIPWYKYAPEINVGILQDQFNGNNVYYYQFNGICSFYNLECYSKIQIYDIVGLKTHQIILNGENKLEINLVKGKIYFVSLTQNSSGKTKTIKIISPL